MYKFKVSFKALQPVIFFGIILENLNQGFTEL